MFQKCDSHYEDQIKDLNRFEKRNNKVLTKPQPQDEIPNIQTQGNEKNDNELELENLEALAGLAK